MSVYEQYDETSRHYDRTRVPIGTEIILGCLARHAGPLSGIHLLDAGCGTGAYAAALMPAVGRLTAIDMSRGMLARARAKLAAEAQAGRAAFLNGSITALPLRARLFDAAMVNQVVHHLGDSPDNGFAGLRRAVGELARVVRPGGVVTLNHCSQEQLRDAYWYYRLAPRAHAAMMRLFAPLPTLHAILEDAGFTVTGSFVPVDGVCQGPAYFDGRGPLDPAWRAGDSFWALVDDEELAAAQARIRALDTAGDLSAFVAAHDARRPAIGQITVLCAIRAPAA